jgi:hypothetical protein
MSVNTVTKGIFVLKRDKVTGEWRKLRDEELRIPHYAK